MATNDENIELTEAEFFNWLQKAIEASRDGYRKMNKITPEQFPLKASLGFWVGNVVPAVKMRMMTNLRNGTR